MLKVLVHVRAESLLSCGLNIGSVPTILAGGINSFLRHLVWSVGYAVRASSRRIGHPLTRPCAEKGGRMR